MLQGNMPCIHSNMLDSAMNLFVEVTPIRKFWVEVYGGAVGPVEAK